MQVTRLREITDIGVNSIGDAANALKNDNMLRLENLDTDIRPPREAIVATRNALEDDDANSYLPFFGSDALRKAVTQRICFETGVNYDWNDNCKISAGGLSGILNVLLAIIEPGDEVIVTDPGYAGILNRIRLAGGVPKLVPLLVVDGGWRIDLEALKEAAGPKTAAVLTMSPSMPSGIVYNMLEWNTIADVVNETDSWLIHDAAMQRIVFSGVKNIHPAGIPLLTEKTIMIGCVSKEYRMIGWRVGWVVGPKKIMNDIGIVSLSNVVCQVGIAMPGATAALLAENDGVDDATAIWQARRDRLMSQLSDLPVVRPDGGWSLLINTTSIGLTPSEASKLCMEKAHIAATPMTGWGEGCHAGQYLRFVYANESVERLGDVRERLRIAWRI